MRFKRVQREGTTKKSDDDDANDNDGSPAGRGMVGLGPIAAFRNLRVVNSAGRTLQVLVPNSVQLSGSGGDVGV